MGAFVTLGFRAASFYFTGDHTKVAVCNGAYNWAQGTFVDPRFYQVLRFSCRPFTTEEHP